MGGIQKQGQKQEQYQAEPQQRCGFFALIGPPNAGKSTLLNQLVGNKVSIVTHKSQTTRSRILGIHLYDQTQLIFIDTPGIFSPKERLDRAMVRAAWDGAWEADEIILVVDAVSGIRDDLTAIIEKLKARKINAILVLNKVDIVARAKLLVLARACDAQGIFTDIFMISALKGRGLDDLRAHLAKRAPYGPWLFPADQVSDMPQRLLAAEITREKLFLNVHQELPYALQVTTESWTERKAGDVRIEQTITVQRDSQRAIILGKHGKRIKAISAAARKEIAEILQTRVHLFLFVKVRENWKDDRTHYAEWQLNFDS